MDQDRLEAIRRKKREDILKKHASTPKNVINQSIIPLKQEKARILTEGKGTPEDRQKKLALIDQKIDNAESAISSIEEPGKPATVAAPIAEIPKKKVTTTLVDQQRLFMNEIKKFAITMLAFGVLAASLAYFSRSEVNDDLWEKLIIAVVMSIAISLSVLAVSMARITKRHKAVEVAQVALMYIGLVALSLMFAFGITGSSDEHSSRKLVITNLSSYKSYTVSVETLRINGPWGESTDLFTKINWPNGGESKLVGCERKYLTFCADTQGRIWEIDSSKGSS